MENCKAPPAARISKVQFGILSSDEISRLSSVEVSEVIINKTGIVHKNGINDSALGTNSNTMLCSTCSCDIQYCPGHTGHIKLVSPVINIEFIPHIHRVLTCVCFYCSRLLLPVDHPKFKDIMSIQSKKRRQSELFTASLKCRRCESSHKKDKNSLLDNATDSGCGGVQPVYIREDIFIRAVFTFTHAEVEGLKHNEYNMVDLTPEKMVQILSHVAHDDIVRLGMDPVHSHPSSMMWTNLVVPPVCIRPPRSKGNQSTANGEDDLTVRLKGIIKCNKQYGDLVRESPTGGTVYLSKYVYQGVTYRNLQTMLAGVKQSDIPPDKKLKTVFGLYAELQRSVAGYQDSKYQKTILESSEYGQDKKSIRHRFTSSKAKKGRMRHTIFGKRQNYSARTVITPCSHMDVDEVGVPRWICMKLTYPDKVHRFNIHLLTQAVRNGPDVYPGANYVTDDKGVVTCLKFVDRYMIQLRCGFVVRRHLVNGDDVLFNRQPSLHKHSLMAHRVKVMDGHSFRLHMAATRPYNADFDGDEMNLQVLMDEMTRAEARELLSVRRNMVKDAVPLVCFQQHAVVSAYLMSRPDHYVEKEEAWQLLYQNKYFDLNRLPHPTLFKKEKEYILSRDVFSSCLPSGMCLEMEEFRIESGRIVTGRLNKHNLNQGVVYTIWKDFGSDTACDFISGMQLLLEAYLDIEGLTVGVDDCYISIPKEVRSTVKVALQYVDGFSDHNPVHTGKSAEVVENNICLVLDKARDVIGDFVLAQLRQKMARNGLFEMIESGAKGNETNIVQIMGIVGQQRNHHSMRMASATSHYNNSSNKACAHGMVCRSFFRGLRPGEYFNHLVGSRVGLVDTAVKSVTADTELILSIAGRIRRLTIGSWVDSLLLYNREKVELYPNEARMELLRVQDMQMYIPTMNDFGQVSWGAITNVTRHDPGETLYCVTTLSGRTVTVVCSKTILVWEPVSRSFLAKLSSDIKIGDFLPSTKFYPPMPSRSGRTFDIGVYIHHSEFLSADESPVNSPNIPYEVILDHGFGFFIGLYLSCGVVRMSPSLLVFVVKDISVQWFLIDYLTTWRARYTAFTAPDSTFVVTTSNPILVKLMNRAFGGSKENRTIPMNLLDSPIEFVTGFFSGIFSGRPLLVTTDCLLLTFTREELLLPIVWLFGRLGVFSSISTDRVVSVCLRWVPLLVSKLRLLNTENNRLLLDILSSPILPFFQAVHDVVLDPVVSIEVSLAIPGQKVYDITVPSTLNFALANGLMVLDTSETGYSQRRIAKAMEDMVVQSDKTVRDVNSDIVQFVYGDDGFDSALVENNVIRVLCMDDETVKVKYRCDVSAVHHMDSLTSLRWDRDKPLYTRDLELSKLISLRSGVCSLLVDSEYSSLCLCPVAFARLLNRAGTMASPTTDLTPYDVYCTVSKFWDNLISRRIIVPTVKLECLFRDWCSTFTIWSQFKLDSLSLRWLLNEVHRVFVSESITPYESVGMIASQHCAEPLTQLTLNRFHKSGQFSHLVSGVTRMKEIINTVKKPKTPSMCIFVKEGLDIEQVGRDFIEVTAPQLITRWVSNHVDPARNQLFMSAWTKWSTATGQILHLVMLIDKGTAIQLEVSPRRLCNALRYTDMRKKYPDIDTMFSYSSTSADVWWVALNIGKEELMWTSAYAQMLKTTCGSIPTEEAVLSNIYHRLIGSCVVKGIQGIEDFFLGTQQITRLVGGIPTKTTSPVLFTKGSNLLGVLAREEVQSHLVSTNHIKEIELSLGIDAACSAIETEWRNVMIINNAHVGARHIKLIAEAMCYRGQVCPMTYQGICRESSSVTMKASFEKVMETFIHGAAQSHVDRVEGCMDVICWNGRLRAGTGRVELVYEPARVPKYISDYHDQTYKSRCVRYTPPDFASTFTQFIRPKTNRILSEKATPACKQQVSFVSSSDNVFRPTSPNKPVKNNVAVSFCPSSFRPWTP